MRSVSSLSWLSCAVQLRRRRHIDSRLWGIECLPELEFMGPQLRELPMQADTGTPGRAAVAVRTKGVSPQSGRCD